MIDPPHGALLVVNRPSGSDRSEESMYGVMVAGRVMVKAQGRSGAGIDDLKNAVESVDMSRVKALAGK